MTDVKLTGTDIGTIVVVLYYLGSVARDLVQAPPNTQVVQVCYPVMQIT